MPPALAKAAGPLLVALGAMLWATDAVFRVPSLERLDPTSLVFLEHAVALLVLAPLAWLRHRDALTKLGARQWLAVAFVGIGGSALATVLFTASFRYLNPSVTILLQKVQPVLVVLTAYAFLGERPGRSFFLWAPLALVSALVLTFPDLQFISLLEGVDPRSRGASYALAAAGLWALGTTVSKGLLREVKPAIATFWRYGFGLAALGALIALGGAPTGVSEMLASSELAIAVVYMAIVPGLLAMLAYYSGLARTPASVATFLELLFPVSAVAINAYYLQNTTLSPLQLAAAAVLLLSVTKVSLSSS